MKRKKVALHNLGCKVNAYETDAMQQMLEQNGFEIIPFAPGADYYIINTCTVTNIADRKSRQMLHKAKKMNPNAIVAAVGCYAQAAKEELEKDEAIDLIIGNNKKKDLITILQEFENNKEEGEFVIDVNHAGDYEELSIDRTAEHTRAYIKVQDGCNQFCSYCIIPYARGRVRSRSMDDVVKEVMGLAKNGYQEVVLTGIHLSSYGIDLNVTLLDLIVKIHDIKGICRIRLGSLEPRIISEEFVKTISKLPKICPHFHLSLQSGCNETLQRMNRKYTAEEYLRKCELLRKHFDHPALTTDVIVGFPGETEEEFAASKAFLEKVEFYETHIFKYSKRKGTRAAQMEGQVSDDIKTKRSNILLDLNKKNKRKFEESYCGRKVEVLFEEKLKLDQKSYYVGHTKEYVRTVIPAFEDFSNRAPSGYIGCQKNVDMINEIIVGTIEKSTNNGILLCKIQ